MNLPNDFTEYSRKLMGDSLYAMLADGLDNEPTPTSVRLNPFKAGGRDVVASLSDGIVPWCACTGRYLSNRPNFTFDPLLHAGVYYVQEAASMFVGHVVRHLIDRPVRMLDLCAAPRGKTTTLRSALPDGSVLFCNEPVRTRANILSENIQKFGHEDVVVTNNYPCDYRKSGIMFDAILADVPCSGEGMFRKDDGARAEWSVQNVDNCWRLQREIISDVWSCLRPGGLLIYSTCTFNAHEDEENVEWIARELGADFEDIPLQPDWNVIPALVGNAPVYRFMPGVSRSEGLFVAVLHKHGNEGMADGLSGDKPKKKKKDKTTKNNARQKGQGTEVPLDDAASFVVRKQDGASYAIPARWADLYDMAHDSLRVMHAGVCVWTEKGRDTIPGQSLALSRRLDMAAFPNVELAYGDAIAYLRKEAVTLPDGTPRGYILLTYKGVPIGFEKNIGNRANNLYPAEWRIKSSHVPDVETEILKLVNI